MRRMIPFFIILLLIGCSQNKYQNVGDIPFDAVIDNPDFKLCNESNIMQYYTKGTANTLATYQGEKIAIINHFRENYKNPTLEGENGYLTIRFIVNCKGESDRFRVQEMDFKYQAKTFDTAIKNQLLVATKALKNWIPPSNNGQLYDFYQYLTFRIENGQIKKIMP